jgi:hypothetical protein
VKRISPARKTKRGEKGYLLRLEDPLLNQVREVARQWGVTQRAVIEDALRYYLAAETATRTDADLAPLINRLIQDQHQTLGKGLRSLTVRVGHEIIRTQYILMNFMAKVGMPESTVDKWHSDGWRYAVREFKLKPDTEGEGPADG